MIKRHIKRLVFPNTWNVLRKENTFSIKPNPSGHNKENSIPISILIRDISNMTKNTKETKQLINDRVVLVDGKKVKTIKRPVGFMDVVSFEKINENYIVNLQKNGKLNLSETKNPKQKICKITKKWMSQGKNISYSTHDGRTFITKNNEYKIGDSLLVEIPNQKILKCLKLEKDCIGMFLGGGNKGKELVLTNIVETGNRQEDYLEFEIENIKYKSPKKLFFVLGNNKKSELV
ncbi:hypothetical protein HOK68_03255 [Candidatus Woesearchaeota archaeon]|jgi:small subunit ribosomal protein S4e|nr:hypothetical protein [Candidatus Woesearchaeota archaeon]MBT4387744.1 hypothetical protein [Candidatus Woesearchaeota archaeon]MBT4595563.1 hypothetical protein [Candidatus Woesearchaeota archaeon]MBT5740954.1 hypothetical protein [Candidatus Woesearchaeota archaeon]MBT6505771.1 hypothetical protein [Candidatus Woesearchaeota archaeon]